MWKVFNISSGLTIKAGFADEDDAQAWLLAHEELEAENYLVEEMDPDEEDEYALSLEEAEVELVEEDDEEEVTKSFVEIDHGDQLDFEMEDQLDDPDSGMYTEVDGDELD